MARPLTGQLGTLQRSVLVVLVAAGEPLTIRETVTRIRGMSQEGDDATARRRVRRAVDALERLGLVQVGRNVVIEELDPPGAGAITGNLVEATPAGRDRITAPH